MDRRPVTFDLTVDQERLLRQTLAFIEEIHDVADKAADGTVLDACEVAVITKGQELQRQFLQQAVQRRVDTAEKKGRRSALVPVVGPRRIADPNPVR